jgi:transcription antitermination factor NusG
MPANWYVLSVKPHKERLVFEYLQNEGIVSYHPTYQVNPVNPRARKSKPYFPGYMFVNVDLQSAGEDCLRWIPGTRGLVRFGSRPAVVPANLITELQTRLQQFEALQQTCQKLQKGDRVRIISGPFAGYEAIFDTYLSGRDRVQVLLAYLNHYTHRLRLNAGDLQRA